MHAKHVTNTLSRTFGRFAGHTHNPWLQRLINRAYVRLMGLDMGEFEPAGHYPSLQALFTRALKADRPLEGDKAAVISPCDGRITQSGTIESDTLFQIKSMPYALSGLLPQLSGEQLVPFDGGSYLNLYLSPKDYHRYHAPATLHIQRLVHIPGRLWPVNLPFLRKKMNLFVENERVVLECEDNQKRPWMLVFVGALNVGRMHFEHLRSFKSNCREAQMSHFEINKPVQKGQLLGWFEMGSTILILAPRGAFVPAHPSEGTVRYGEAIGVIQP